MKYLVLILSIFALLLIDCQIFNNTTSVQAMPCGSEKCYTPNVASPVMATQPPNEVYPCYPQELCTPAPTSTLSEATATLLPNEHPYKPEATLIPPTYATDDPDWADYATHQARVGGGS